MTNNDYSLDSDLVKQLDSKIMDFIGSGVDSHDAERFNMLALMEFEYQFNVNEIYRELCTSKGVTPGSISKWEDIPVVPSKAFRDNILASFPLEKTELLNFSGGTTSTRRAQIYRDKRAVDLVFEANVQCTRSFLFPDLDTMKILFMVPSPKIAPTMGMAVGLEQVRKNFGTSDSSYLITPKGLNMKVMLDSLEFAHETGEPLALIGATAGFIYFFNICQEQGLSFDLPEGSRICDGGGYSGRFGDCNRDEFFNKCEDVLGIQGHYCVNTYGTAETSTNFFDNVLKDHFSGRSVNRYKPNLPWTRTTVVDTRTFERLPEGEIGLLRHYDVTNRAMVMGVQTSNLGYETEGGFEIIGRAGVKKGEILTTPVDRMVGHMADSRMGGIMDMVMNILFKFQAKKHINKKSKEYKRRRENENPQE